jgi:hypothetical protein
MQQAACSGRSATLPATAATRTAPPTSVTTDSFATANVSFNGRKRQKRPTNRIPVALTNTHSVGVVRDALIESAERNLGVRDGVASFFYHPFLAIEHLERVVVGIKDLGYEFVPADAVIGDLTPPAHARVP